VRRAGGRVRITAQLIETRNDSHLWAERYDRDLNDIFALQGEISQAIVASLKVKLLPEEKRAIVTRSTLNPNAYELYLQARHYQQQRGARNLEIALRFCDQALEIDPIIPAPGPRSPYAGPCFTSEVDQRTRACRRPKRRFQ
jgi:Predicted integral membrane protein